METVVVDVLRTPELQRLRRIRQLGLSHFVFPGAEHSRLAHSLGASYLALKFGRQLMERSRDFLIDELSPTPESIRDLAVAALCHDLGHGPLSHAWEREIVGENYDFDRWIHKLGLAGEKDNLRDAKWHELVGQGLLAWEDGKLHRLLEGHDAGFSRRLRYLLRGKYYLPYLPRLLASDVDVDRADFLRRDTHQCGVAYGRYDLDWLISTCTVGQTDQCDLVVGFDKRKAVRVVEQFLIARRALYETVYYHKTVRIVEGMVALFLRRLKEVAAAESGRLGVFDFLKPLIAMISGEVLSPPELLSLDDFALWILIQAVSEAKGMDETVHDLGQRILARDLFKIVPCPNEKVREFLLKPDGHDRLHSAIQPFCSGKAAYYLYIDSTNFAMLAERPGNMAYLVDENRLATPIRDNEALRGYRAKPEESLRLFTLSEAVGAVVSAIG
ncbi:MAG: HD domain-containing protein [Bryobacteraceae bacterium]